MLNAAALHCKNWAYGLGKWLVIPTMLLTCFSINTKQAAAVGVVYYVMTNQTIQEKLPPKMEKLYDLTLQLIEAEIRRIDPNALKAVAEVAGERAIKQLNGGK